MTMSSLSFNSCSAPFSAGVRLLWVGMFVLVAVWTSFLTKSIKDSNVVFLLGFGIHELFFLNLGRGISLSSSESDDSSTGQSLSLAEKYSLIRRDLANLSRSADSCSSFILLGVGQKLSPLESIRISAGFRSFDDKLTTVSFWSLLISLCLENLRFRLIVSPEVTDNSDGIFLFGLIPSLKNFLRCFSLNFRLWILWISCRRSLILLVS